MRGEFCPCAHPRVTWPRRDYTASTAHGAAGSMDQRTSSGAQEPQPLPHCNPALQQEGAYLVDLLIRFNNRPQHKGTASLLIQ